MILALSCCFIDRLPSRVLVFDGVRLVRTSCCSRLWSLGGLVHDDDDDDDDQSSRPLLFSWRPRLHSGVLLDALSSS